MASERLGRGLTGLGGLQAGRAETDSGDPASSTLSRDSNDCQCGPTVSGGRGAGAFCSRAAHSMCHDGILSGLAGLRVAIGVKFWSGLLATALMKKAGTLL